MDINTVNSASPGSLSALVNAALDGQSVTPRAMPAPVLSGDSVTVTASSRTTDVEKLAALLLQEANEAREDSILSHLKALSENGVFEALCDQVNGAAREAFERLDEISAEASETENALEGAKKEKAQAEADLKTAQQEKSTADQTLASLKADPNASEEAIQAAQKDVSDAAKQVARAEAAVAAAEDKIAKLNARLNEQNAEITKIAGNLDTNGYRLLMEALNINAEIMEHHVNPLENGAQQEEVERGGNVPLSERSPLAIIRDALRRQEGDMRDTLETRRENHI